MYWYGEHEADLEIHAEADTLPLLCIELAKGISEWMFGSGDQGSSATHATTTIIGEGLDSEDLVVDWLSKLLTEMLTREMRPQSMVPGEGGSHCAFNSITSTGTAGFPFATGAGLKCLSVEVNFNGQELEDEIKAVTYHGLSVQERNGRWLATVVCDL